MATGVAAVVAPQLPSHVPTVPTRCASASLRQGPASKNSLSPPLIASNPSTLSLRQISPAYGDGLSLRSAPASCSPQHLVKLPPPVELT